MLSPFSNYPPIPGRDPRAAGAATFYAAAFRVEAMHPYGSESGPIRNATKGKSLIQNRLPATMPQT
jgi:hypothetical protein